MSKSTLFVILGAGASFDASTRFTTVASRPPLVARLFDTRFDEILDRYPMAKNATPEVRDAVAATDGASAVSLEDHLRTQYRDSTDELDRRRFYSIALYLQHVLMSVSSNPRAHFDNLDRLVNATLRAFDHVCFVTLNYDVLLDRCLSAISPLSSLQDFIAHDRWSLIKLHGSVTWGREIVDSAELDLDNPPADLENRLRDEIYHSWTLSLEQARQGSDSDHTFNVFPALSVPVGSEDELVCPPSHEEFLDERLSSAEAIDLLVIGYSAYDTAVIKKLEIANTVRSLFIVNASTETASDVAVRLAPQLGLSPNPPVTRLAPNRFGEWVRVGLPGYLHDHPAL